MLAQRVLARVVVSIEIADLPLEEGDIEEREVRVDELEWEYLDHRQP